MSVKINVEGLKKLSRELKKIDPDIQKQLKQLNYDAAEIVKARAQKSASYQSRMAGKASKSLRSSKSATMSQITAGNKRYPYTIGTIFGSKKYGQFKPWRENNPYWFFPDATESQPEIIIVWTKRLQEILDKGFTN
jgi:mRNA-degrading endonuclease RelE of RelBE toxin-antitoxin system